MATLFTIKVTNPVTLVSFEESIKFGKVRLLNVHGLDKECLVHVDCLAINYSLSNVEDVFPGSKVLVKDSSLLGLFPSKEETGHLGPGDIRKNLTLRISNLNGSIPVFKNPVIVTIRISDK